MKMTMMMNKSNVNMMSGVVAAVLFVLSMVVLGTVDAQTLGTPGNNNHYTQPNHSGGIGGCNSDGSFCWSIDIDDQGGYHNPTRPYPGQVFGFQAKNLIAYGQITYANLNSWGIMHLGVYNHGWPWECEIDLRGHMPNYRCTAQ